MAKVIVERPRYGSRGHKPKGYQRRLTRLAGESGPVREGMKKLWRGGTKGLNEHLGPLRRFLDSQVGRPWDKVFSEICRHINRNSAVQDHVRDHVDGYVARKVMLVDGVLYQAGAGRFGGTMSALQSSAWILWYVCPRTGLLKRNPAAWRRRRPPAKKPQPHPFVRLDATTQCRHIDGSWHLVTLKPFPPFPARCTDHDVILNQQVCSLTVDVVRKHYGAALYAVACRRLSKKEMPQLPIPMAWWG
jgi:hypothetical protein